MRFYDLDANGWPLSSFARQQGDRNLPLLPDQPDSYHYWDGEQWVEDTDAKTADVERECLDAIDAKAESVRQRFVTPGNYQPSEYERAREEAKRLQAGDITESDALQADVEGGIVDPRTGNAVADQTEAADLILYRDQQWAGALDLIRLERLKGKGAVRDATTVQGKRDACDAAVAALDAIEPQ